MQAELAEVSALQTRSVVMAVFHKPVVPQPTDAQPTDLTLILDDVQDPGNLGTIVRTADWFGVRKIVCSPLCADAYGPKAVAASMGAISRVAVAYANLPSLLSRNADNWHVPVYGTFLDGRNVYTSALHETAFLIMGNEGKGISASVSPFVSERLFIPNFPVGSPTSESLNVSAATAIVLSEFRRRVL